MPDTDNPDPRVDTARLNLKLAATRRGLSLSEIAMRAGMQRNGLSQFTNGRTSISYANLLRICDVLQIPIGLLDKPDAITEARLRIYAALERLPDHMADQVMAAVKSSKSGTPAAPSD